MNYAQYILLINNDTVVQQDFLNCLVETYESMTNVGIVTGKIYYYDERDVLWFGGSYYDECRYEMKIDGIGKKDSSEYSKRKKIPFATGCLWLMSVETLKIVGKMSEDYFLYYEDADYCKRITDSGLQIIYEPSAVIYHKESRSTKKGSRKYQYYNIRNYLIYIRKFCNTKNKCKAYTNCLFRDCKEVIRGRMSASVVFKAWKDFVKGKHGMVKMKS
jgi:GT2 family glycosyltransferase